MDAIDLYQIHWPVPDPAEMDEGWSTLAALREEGKVRFIGVSNYDVDQLRRASDIAPVTSLQPRYSLIHREIEQDVLPVPAERRRRHRLLADGGGPAHGQDDARARRGVP